MSIVAFEVVIRSSKLRGTRRPNAITAPGYGLRGARQESFESCPPILLIAPAEPRAPAVTR
jgi:hypothetical protein